MEPEHMKRPGLLLLLLRSLQDCWELWFPHQTLSQILKAYIHVKKNSGLSICFTIKQRAAVGSSDPCIHVEDSVPVALTPVGDLASPRVSTLRKNPLGRE